MKIKEIEEVIDLMDYYPLWMQIKNNKTGKKQDIPSELYDILGSFWECMKETIKQQLRQKLKENKLK